MLRFDIITGLPELLRSPFEESIVKRAREKEIVQIVINNLRDYTFDKHKTIDDTPYGGGAGMVLKIEPIYNCIQKLQSERKYDEIIYLTPQGELFNQKMSNEFSLKNNIMLLCGHYKGIDNRVVENFITKEISIGDYVLSGGELAAAIVVDSIVRLLPGAIGDGESLLSDSFQDGLLSFPSYTKPAEFNGLKVPEVLLSGNHKMIEEWREEQSISITKKRRKDLL